MAIQTEKFGFVVRNQSTGEKLSGALVELRENSNNYVLTEVGTSGFYQIASIPTGKYEVYVDSVNSNATMAVGAGQIAALGNIIDNVPISTTDAYEFKTPDGLKLVLDLDQVANVAIPIPTGGDTNKIIVVDSAGDYQLVDASSADDQLVKVSSADTTSGYLDGKLIAGTNITLTKGNVGADETLEISSTGATIPTPALDGSFLVKNTNGTFTLLDGVSGPPMRWDSANSRFLWQGQLDFTGAYNLTNGSIQNFLDASGVQDAFIANQSGGGLTMASNNGLTLIAGDDVYIAATNIGKKIQLDSLLVETTSELKVGLITVGTQVGLVGYDSAGKLIQGTAPTGTQDLDSVLTQGNSSSQNINLTSGASLNVDGQVDVGGILDVGENASSPQTRLGKNTFATTTGAGISQLISGGSIFYDFKTDAAGTLFFRCGEGAEAGSAHQFMVVDPTDGSVKIPNLPTGTQVGLVGYDSTGKLIEADRQLTTQASTNPSTMAVDASLYKQISANNLAQTCTIPLPTNGVDGSKVIYRFRAVATSTLSWNAGFNDLKGALPTSIAINKSLYVGVIYDAFTSTWDVVSVVEQN
jgi:hypothetical protein